MTGQGKTQVKRLQDQLAQWVSLRLQKTLTMQNIQIGFKATNIQSFNKDAMVGQNGAK